eukprot:CAMPEP_0172459778 /NCGR_PEP_ID=MMETSP1065-20121228/34120_1 /TAXON_ID=265537 /ORGANISM="Amphiprora paludosa, Strain CCMP125" /LENGTH=674 /DNA_ID=CAMNT_0013214605 /DNA_START=57 /DNA_END=2081 /DNA_ORIENTATION=-
MADSASRAQRAAALEEKRRKLEELKKKRALRSEDTAKVKTRAQAKHNLDEYIDGLLSTPSVAPVAAEARSELAAEKQAEAAAAGAEGGSVPDSQKAPASQQDGSAQAEGGVGANAALMNNAAQSIPTPPIKQVETFAMSTQTDPEDFPEKEPEDEEPELEEEAEDADKAEMNGAEVEQEEEKIPKLLTENEVEKEVVEAPFTAFITSASKKVERVMGTPLLNDLLANYIGEDSDAKGDARAGDDKDSDVSRFISSRQVYECSKWTGSRDITDINWSPLHRELFLSTYHVPGSTGSASPITGSGAAVSAIAPNDTLSSQLTPRGGGEIQSDGLALVWSLSMPNRPEHVFTCGSPVTTGRFHPTESTLILGGCESGQLVVWDVRAGRLPVQKSTLTTVSGASAKSHTHPICTMEVIEGGLGLATASTEGRVNYWSLGNLREPVESVQVGESVSCFSVAPESGTLLLGDEHGSLHSISSSGGQRSSRKQLRKLESTDAEGEALGHYGMVTSISAKVLKSGSSLRTAGLSKGFLRGSGGLVLTSGVDWTVKLWSPAYSDTPLMSFVSHSYDYMCDAQWSPVHPSLFATASSNGTVGLWDISKSMEEPITGKDGIVVEPDVGLRGLNKVQWSNDGRRMAVASGDLLHVLNLTEDVARPKGDEDKTTMNQLLARGLITRQ